MFISPTIVSYFHTFFANWTIVLYSYVWATRICGCERDGFIRYPVIFLGIPEAKQPTIYLHAMSCASNVENHDSYKLLAWSKGYRNLYASWDIF